jgi:hypothetical protein
VAKGKVRRKVSINTSEAETQPYRYVDLKQVAEEGIYRPEEVKYFQGQDFLAHINSGNHLYSSPWRQKQKQDSLCGCLFSQKELTLSTTVHRKPTHTDCYLNYQSNHPPQVKRGIVQSLRSRAITVCQERQDLLLEIDILKQDFYSMPTLENSFLLSIVLKEASSQERRLSRLVQCSSPI